MLGQEQVWPDDARHLIFERRGALEFDEFRRLALIQPPCDPLGLLAFGALAIKEIDGAVELKQHTAEIFQVFGELRTEAERGRGGSPLVAGEEPLRWNRL